MLVEAVAAIVVGKFRHMSWVLVGYWVWVFSFWGIWVWASVKLVSESVEQFRRK